MNAISSPPVAEASPLDLPFAALMTKRGASQLWNVLAGSGSQHMAALFAFFVLDRDEMVTMLRSLAAEGGPETAMELIEAISSATSVIQEASRLAEMAQARAFLTFHVALDISIEETSSPSAWDEAVAAERAARSALNAAPVGSPNDDELAGAWEQAIDHLIDDVPAPDVDALAIKLRLSFEHCQGHEFFDSHRDAILRDVQMLAGDAA